MLLFHALLFVPTMTIAQIKPIKPFGTTRAVVVGVSEYAEISDLAYAHRDAEAFATFLQSETAWKVSPEHLRLLTNEEATIGKFVQALKWLVAESQAEDRAIIYFSGHGDVELEGRLGYLLLHTSPPVDYVIGGSCSLAYLNAIVGKLTQDKQAEVILITDACRSGKLAGSESGGTRLFNRELMDQFNNTVKIMSCEPEQFSLEGPQWGDGRGLFSYHLVNGLIGMADEDQNNYIELFEIEDYLRKEVRTASRQYGHMQIPITRGRQETQLNRVDKKSLARLMTQEADAPAGPSLVVATRAPGFTQRDTAFLSILRQFEAALENGHLMYPKEGSALSFYEALEKIADIDRVREEAKGELVAAFQDAVQPALNAYLQTPGKELAERWANGERYAYYPDYLLKAAELVGPQDFFYQDFQARADYFKGVNLRLQAEKMKDTLLWQEAISLQRQSLEKQPNTAHVFNELGLLYFGLGTMESAIQNFQKAHELSPAWVLPLSNLTACYNQLGQYEAAEQTAQQAIALDTSLVLSQNNLGVIYLDQGKLEAAKIQFQKAVQLDSSYPLPYYNLGKVFLAQEKYADAATHFSRYAELSPQDPAVFNALGYLYYLWDKPEEAEPMYQKCLEVDPTHRYGLYNFATFYLKQHQYEKAIQLFQKYKGLEPQDPDVYYDLACSHALNGDATAAIDALRTLFSRFEFKDLDQLNADSDLDSLRGSAAYQALIKEFFPEKN